MVKIESIWQDTPGILLESRKDSFEDALEVFNSFNHKDKLMIYDNGIKKPNPYTVWRKVVYLKNTSIPIGFVEFVDTGKSLKDKERKGLTIEIAVKKEYRGKGVASHLIKEALKFFKAHNEYQSIIWPVLKSNHSSEHLAIKFGFVYMWTDEDRKEKSYLITKAKWLDAIK